jgi:thioredoxin reductase (NADPH)
MLTTAAIVGPTILLFAFYLHKSLREERRSVDLRDAAVEAGLTEPPSLHPVIDDSLCIGCGGCVDACPEGKILGLVQGRAQLIEPSHCIGHGACKTACPADAIELVFGTEKRGLDIPTVSPAFETNVPGLFIAGELGGMGLIRNAIEQGRQAMESVRKLDGLGQGSQLDVIVVGAGPAGFSASLAAMQHKLRCVTIEQDTLGGTVSHYPRGKIVMTAPVRLPVVGMASFRETTKEKLLSFWEQVEGKTGVKINYSERLEEVARTPTGFTVVTSRNTYQTRAVLLAIGRRGTPRKLGVPGEDHEKVVYRLIDPEQFRSRHVLVVGGGDSALEAAISISEEPGTTVALSYRSEAFGRAKLKNREKVDKAAAAGRLNVLLKSTVKSITPDRVTIEHDGKQIDLPNEAVIVCAGGILPTPFLKKIGIEVETRHGTV